jgi:hypothetical protein
MLAVALLVLSAVSTGVGPAPAGGRLPLPPPRAALQFEPGMKEIGLDELVLRLAQLTGQELAMTPQTQQVLQQSSERLESTEPVPPEEVYAFVEGLLARQGVILAPVTGGSRPILGVSSPENSRSPMLDPLYVERDALPELEGHPALLVRFLVRLENIDARQVQTQLRQLLVDNTGTNQVVPVGELALILQGRAREVAGIAKLLLEADKAAAGRRAPAPAEEGAK